MAESKETCGTCKLISRRDQGAAPAWDSILRTDDWDVVHAYDTSLLGWIVLVPRRHVLAVDALNRREMAELAGLIHSVSRFLKADLGCLKTYVMQFAEHPEHPHVHFHVVPRMPDLPAEHKGPGIFAYLGAAEDEQVADDAKTELALRLRSWLV